MPNQHTSPDADPDLLGEGVNSPDKEISQDETGGNVRVRQVGGRQRGSSSLTENRELEKEFFSPPPGGDPENSGEGVSNYEANNSLKNESAKKIHGVYGDLVFVDPLDTGKVVRTWISTPFNRKEVNKGWAPPHPTLYLRREVYEQHGLFDISFRIAGDYDQMLRIMRKENIQLTYLPGTIVRMRKGGASTGNLAELLRKKGEDLRVLRNNGFRFPFGVLLMKNLRKIPQLLRKD